jgi:DNA-binding FadR family transcriptional regulator
VTSLAPVKHDRVSLQIVQQIAALINSGEFPPGTPLPPERELAQQLEVSRSSLREALSALQLLGLIETKPGQGSYTCAAESLDTAYGQLGPTETDESPHCIMQARKAIEPPIAALAAEKRSDADLKHMAEILQLLDVDLESVHAFGEQGRRFHLAIAEATGNRVLVRVMSIVYRLMGQRLFRTMWDASSNTEQLWREDSSGHWGVYKAIEAGDKQAAAAELLNHLEHVDRLMLSAEQRPEAAGSGASPRADL